MSNLRNSRGVTRRDVLTAGAGGALLAGLGPIISTRAYAAAPKSGGHLRLGLSNVSTTDSSDPATWATIYMQIGFTSGIYNNLAEIGADNRIAPELAESWSVSDDARVWTFKLRKEVKFHNGKPLEASDVIASLNHHRGPDSKSAAKTLLKPITNLRADGKHTVVFELESGNADFPYLLSDYHLVIMPAKDGNAEWRDSIGTGGYMLVDFQPGVRLALKRNPNYWKAGHAHFDTAELLGITDTTARINALVGGEVDAINRVDPKLAKLIERRPGVMVEDTPSNQVFTLPMMVDAEPFTDNNVRLAMKYAIDREALLKTILAGHGTVANDHMVGPFMPFYAKDLKPQHHYDPDQAKHYLKQAGRDTLKVDLHVSDTAFAGAVDAAVLYQEQAAKCGIDLNVVREPADGYWSNVWLKKSFCAAYWTARPTADAILTIACAADAPWNASHWKNPRFNELLVAARAELDEHKRSAMYHEMQQIMSEDGGRIVPLYANFIDARSDKLAHAAQISNAGELDGGKILERWWFA